MPTIRLAALIALTATPALAHTGPGVAHGFAAGLTHPLLGLDHVLAMVAVGMWAGLIGGRALWAWPAAFVATMILGALVGMAAAAPAGLEAAIALSVVALGAAAAFRLNLPLLAGTAVCGALALLHGWAHGSELPADTGALAYVAGFALATVGLHALGVIAVATVRSAVPARIAGGAVAATGLVLTFL
jgi:urease accessory protein